MYLVIMVDVWDRPGCGKVCQLIHAHTNAHRRIKCPSAISRPTAHFACGLTSDLVICELKEYDVVYGMSFLRLLI